MKNPYLIPAALFGSGVVLFGWCDSYPGLNWLEQLAGLLSALGSVGLLWTWSRQRKSR